MTIVILAVSSLYRIISTVLGLWLGYRSAVNLYQIAVIFVIL
jgi:hypothetical protein